MRLNKKAKIIVLVVCTIVVILIFAVLFLLKYFKYKQYDPYKDKIEYYGFSDLYNNKMATSYQSVTKLEAVKIIMASALDNTNINDFILEGDNDDEKWQEYALRLGILTNEEKEEVNTKATYIDIIRYISNANYYILNNQFNTEEIPTFSDFNDYKQSEKINISDLVSNKIIENSNSSLNGNRNISKGELNKLVINFYEQVVLSKKYGDLKNNENDMPSNSSEYPFVLNEVENNVYEQEFKLDDETNFISPKKMYSFEKGNYEQIITVAEDYYNRLLNIDYSTINKDSFMESIKEYTLGNPDEETMNEYVEYVKANKISISGKATAQVPIIYLDGISVRVRMKLEFDIKSSNTKDNLLYLDSTYGDIIEYKDNNIIYIDAILGYVANSDNVYNDFNVIYDMRTDDLDNTLSIRGK